MIFNKGKDMVNLVLQMSIAGRGKPTIFCLRHTKNFVSFMCPHYFWGQKGEF